VSNNEFAQEFSRRSTELFPDQDVAQRVLDEFDTLDPREALLVHRAFSQESDSIEFLHTKTRISALVASGSMSADLAKLAIGEFAEETVEEQPTPVDEQSEEEYLYSRLALMEELSDDYNMVIDPNGVIRRMAERGDSKEKITAALNKNVVFSTRAETYEQTKDSDDLELQIGNFQFKSLMEAIDGLLDPAEAPDFGAIAKNLLTPYDEYGSIAKMIDGGAKSNEVFAALDGSEEWMEDYRDYSTRNDVQSPRFSQLASWGTFLDTVKAIKDLDYR
jgi:hypothetical protein